ncbi:pirin family protein [Pluralibacter gergoviae]|uniref:pirin family protein n=1 Tax=Pluralibacter gergoviae TaxID=61647 RepID=UPI000BFE0226|nr:pirin family protein [Pluralibacter gergoviae]MCK1064734.1 pirin family protein [Pluralibacter gergoviae]MCV7761255.1 pirin family protein [Pluralibacter gergoviae]PHH47916.1 quercetin 2,3-dioxygenase [Pluralibacter gergoviae]HDS1234323.1 pirin family protein [Pluralibacter gergoviae]HDS1240160.1 pirin family protein [Pluralibacter gergoviae]
MAMLPAPRQRISARVTDVGGIGVSRALPVRERRLIGAWCFLDHAGPAVFERGQEGMHVGPHPHVGLQTFTWMLDGEVLHRDSLGYRQTIRPGQVNLMTAGRGIAHSEDTAPGHTRLHAAQLWIALPDAARNMPPRFDHYPELPQWRKDNIDFTLLVGDAGGHSAPTLHFSPLLGIDMRASSEATTTLPLRPDFEYGAFVLEGEAAADDESIALNELLYLGDGLESVRLTLKKGARILLLGGAKLSEPVMMWWNFVGRSKAEIQACVSAWNSGDPRFGRVVDDERAPTRSPVMP